ncbi:MAG: GYF domain-containing protein [Planctomycetaceae bacterium]|nr:GYF domain-containing protein [Planctomycetaceae bacterium]
MIDIVCHGCGKRLKVSEQHAGRKGKCPGCGGDIEIPSRVQEAAPQTAPEDAEQQPPQLPLQDASGSDGQGAARTRAPQALEPESACEWHYCLNEQTSIPMPLRDIVELVRQGKLPTNVLVWRGGMVHWAPANALPEFCDAGVNAVPPVLTVGGALQPTTAPYLLDEFSIGVFVLLHFLTGGVFNVIWLNLMHGRMPPRRVDDPSAGKAIGFLFIPFFNLYWMLFTYRRLCLRLNEVRVEMGLPGDIPQALPTAMCVLTYCTLATMVMCSCFIYVAILPALANAVVTLIFFIIVQSKVNEMIEVRRRRQTG